MDEWTNAWIHREWPTLAGEVSRSTSRQSSGFILWPYGSLWDVWNREWQGDICTGETEHGILLLDRAERSFGQRAKIMECYLKGGRETGWENHSVAFSLTFPPGKGRDWEGTALEDRIWDYFSEDTQNNPTRMGTSTHSESSLSCNGSWVREMMGKAWHTGDFRRESRW